MDKSDLYTMLLKPSKPSLIIIHTSRSHFIENVSLHMTALRVAFWYYYFQVYFSVSDLVQTMFSHKSLIPD